MANSPKNTDASGSNVTVKKSDIGKTKTDLSSSVKTLTPAQKRRNELIERRNRSVQQAKNNRTAQTGGKKEVLKDGEKKPFFLVRWGKAIVKKFKEMRSELKKVTWPTHKEAFKQTLVVLAVVACFLVVLFVMDLGLSNLLKLLVSK
ncbi:MAG: preprotein translocase subunit SecE [Clostridiales bacterium]|jgi:preprotein translocase subunit SecE|nr:preprotein translocase subunit SecE [Clostridiales bacterium]